MQRMVKRMVKKQVVEVGMVMDGGVGRKVVEGMERKGEENEETMVFVVYEGDAPFTGEEEKEEKSKELKRSWENLRRVRRIREEL